MINHKELKDSGWTRPPLDDGGRYNYSGLAYSKGGTLGWWLFIKGDIIVIKQRAWGDLGLDDETIYAGKCYDKYDLEWIEQRFPPPIKIR